MCYALIPRKTKIDVKNVTESEFKRISLESVLQANPLKFVMTQLKDDRHSFFKLQIWSQLTTLSASILGLGWT